MLLIELVAVSGEVASTRSRLEKTQLLADVFRRLEPNEAAAATAFLAGSPRQPKLGVGPATVYGVEAMPATTPSLEIEEVDEAFVALAAVSGPGSQNRRSEILESLLGRATSDEQDYLRGLMVRNLRQGALEGVMADAVAAALDVPVERVRRAAMVEGDLVSVATAALVDGVGTLAEAGLSVFTPVQPMLAKTSESAGEAVTELGEVVVEAKLDGLRLQVHRRSDDVKVYTRNLRDVTEGMAAVAASALQLAADSFILDGEGLMIGEDGQPLSFQDSMSRPESGGDRPLTAFYFDILHLDGEDLIDAPLSERRAALQELVPEPARVRSIATSEPAVAEEFFSEVVDAGFEGVVVKDPSQAYAAGRRGSGWLKVKPTHTLDLVVLGAEWGSGRRQGWLSNLHLGARDEDGGLVMLGKTFKGLTDEMLAWQTQKFLEVESSRDGRTVYIEPGVVYEIAFDGVQRSTRYPGGVALRFARVKGYRADKDVGDADTLATVRSYLR